MHKALLLPLIALLAAQGIVPAEPPSRVLAIGKRGGVIMAPAELLAGPYVRRVRWASDGSALLIERLVVPDDVDPAALLVARRIPDLEGIAPLSRRTELLAWSPRTRRTRLLLAYDPETTTLGYLNPVVGSDRFVADLRERLVDPATGRPVVRLSHLILSVGAGTLLRVPVPGNAPGTRLEFSPRGAVVLVQNAAGAGQTLWTVAANGSLGRAVTLSEGVFFRFDANGTPFAFVVKPVGNGRKGVEAHRLDLASGIVGAKADFAEPRDDSDVVTPATGGGANGASPADPPAPEIAVVSSSLGPDAPGVMLVLDGSGPERVAVVTSDGTNPDLSPKHDAVTYLSGGSAYVRTLARLTLAEVAKAQADTERELTVERGRQIARGLSLYAQDADDALPPLGFDVQNAAGPYVRSNGILAGYVALFGGDLPKEGLDRLTIGYLPGPGGRVLVYADGSARWQPDGG